MEDMFPVYLCLQFYFLTQVNNGCHVIVLVLTFIEQEQWDGISGIPVGQNDFEVVL